MYGDDAAAALVGSKLTDRHADRVARGRWSAWIGGACASEYCDVLMAATNPSRPVYVQAEMKLIEMHAIAYAVEEWKTTIETLLCTVRLVQGS